MRLVAKDTVEERVRELQKIKASGGIDNAGTGDEPTSDAGFEKESELLIRIFSGELEAYREAAAAAKAAKDREEAERLQANGAPAAGAPANGAATEGAPVQGPRA